MSTVLIIIAVVAAVAAVLGLGVGAMVMLGAKSGQKALTAADPPKQIGGGGGPDVLTASVKDLRRGAVVQVSGFGDDFEDVQLEVEGYTRYSRGRDEWHVLQATYKDRPVGLGWDEGQGALRVLAYKHLRGKRLADLGLSPEQLAGLKKGDTVEALGQTWTVEDAEEALSHKDGTGFGKEHQSWELAASDGKQVLRLEQWGDDAPEASLGERIDPAGIEIFRVKG